MALRRRNYKIEDLNRTELDLLAKASYIPKDHFMCFGKYYHKLYALNLVDKELQLTNDGLSMARAWVQYREEERSEKAKSKVQD